MSGPNAHPIHLGVPGEDIDRRDLATVVRRFKNLHRLQAQHIQECQTLRQREFLDLLPLLFHCNHPNLPGFVSLDTPAGLPDYQPGRATLRCAAKLSKSFESRSRGLRPEYPIDALYLMGSVGSIAYSRKSDLDIWLCHRPGLATARLAELHRKAAGIEQWAASLGLEAHIFFIDSEMFRQGQGTPVSTESCGSVQHHLLLEEFYRTSVWLAGRIPGWWLVPPEQEERYGEYLRHLIDNRFVNADDLIDFGGLERVRPEEFLGGALWHLNKAIASPHKSLLKLLLMESYSAEYPRIEWLCTRLKAALYQDQTDSEELDSYLLMYRKVERYLLARGETARLELARQSFYLKINGLMAAVTAAPAEKARRREILARKVRDWGWPPARLKAIEQRRRWRVVAALEEQKAIVGELRLSYEGMRRFALLHSGGRALVGEEIIRLGRRMSAALERKPGKIDSLCLDGGDHIEPEDYALQEIRLADGEPGWALSLRREGGASAAPILRKTRSLLEGLTWLVHNNLYRPSMNPYLETQHSVFGPSELRQACDALAGVLKTQRAESETLDEYSRPPRAVAVALFINLGADAEAQRRANLRLASNRYDALSYGYERANLIERVDALILTSWREILVHQYQGLTGLFACLAELVNESGGEAPRFHSFCFATTRARTIAGRVEAVYRALRAAFGAGAARYVVRGGRSYFLFERLPLGVEFRELPDEERLYAELAATRASFASLSFDPALAGAGLDPLPALYRCNKPGAVQVFCLAEAAQVRVFILDERGSLFHRVHEPLGPSVVLGPYAVFLGAVLQRYVLAAAGIEYYLVERDGAGEYAARPAGLPPGAVGKKIEVRVFAQEIGPGRAAYTIACDDWECSSMESGQDVFAAAAERILALRRSGLRYPIHISDIDLPLSILGVETPEQLQTMHFLLYKRKIEQRLNQPRP
ncbi:class I adenylate cyclase [Methylomagnum ishizawai]|uniref:class I adenylate cyclase n=1 Tax=Methylomagnum ishizawai TaxID=1760988 RepID=UPI001C33A360|nr:class I adenylate cyclase [Methylomagnum ishizawai]BBL77019.1 adenylate cyclase [Methylomagnum ishizawai]